MQKLICEFKANPSKGYELQARRSDSTFKELEYARQRTEENANAGGDTPFPQAGAD